MNQLVRFSLLSAFALTTVGWTSAQEADGRAVIDWGTLTIGEPPPKELENGFIGIRGEGIKAFVAGPQTTPPSPFPNGAAALYANVPESDRLNMIVLVSPSPQPKGWIEFDFSVEKLMVIDLMQRPPGGGTPQSVATGGKTLYNIFVRPGDTILVRSVDQTDKIQLHPKVEESVPSSLRIAWDYTVDPPVMSFKVGGQDGTDKDGTPLVVPIRGAEKGEMIDIIRFTPFTGFIGDIRASE